MYVIQETFAQISDSKEVINLCTLFIFSELNVKSYPHLLKIGGEGKAIPL